MTQGPRFETIIKKVRFHSKARETVHGFPKGVKRDIGDVLLALQRGKSVGMPQSRPMPTVGAGVSEIRVKDRAGTYRVFYLLRMIDRILVFHAFQKKSQETPAFEIELARKRLKEILWEQNQLR